MPKLTDSELARQWAIRIMKELIMAKPAFADGINDGIITVTEREITSKIESLVESVSGRKVV